MAKKPRKRAAKKRKAPTSSDAPAGFSLENLGGFDYEAAVKRLREAKSSVSVDEIRKCVAEIDYKKRLPAIAAIMCAGCCICNWMLLTICAFVYYVVGPSLVKDFGDFKKDCVSATEYIALKTGEIRELDWKWVKLKKNRDKLEDRSKKKVEARLETTTAPAQDVMQEDSGGEEDEEHDAAARAVLDESCTLRQLWEIRGDKLGIRGQPGPTKPKTIDVIMEKLREEASGLQAVWKSNSTQCCPRDSFCSTLTSTQVRGNGPARGAVKNVLRCGRRRGRGHGEAARGVRLRPRAGAHASHTSRKGELLQGWCVPGGRGESLRRVDY